MSDKKTAVVYRSKTGFTRSYAKWLSEELQCDLLEGSKVTAKDLMKYDSIIYGAGLYASGISGIKLITGNFDALKEKELYVFAVGASPVRPETTEYLRNTNFTGEWKDMIHFYYLRGGFDYTRLSRFYRFLMTLKKFQLKHTKNPNADAKGMLASYDHPLDFTKKKHIEPIVRDLLEDPTYQLQIQEG